MKINSDFRDLLRSFNGAGVRYLVVGGYAVMVHAEPRYTKDLDLWIEPTEPNAQLMIGALKEFGAPTSDVVPSDFTEPEVFFQIGIDPVRADIMTSVLGLDFEPAWKKKVLVDFGGESAPVLCREDVLRAKIAAGRLRIGAMRRSWRTNGPGCGRAEGSSPTPQFPAIEIVTPAGLLKLPICKLTGTATPGVIPVGTCTSTCIMPATDPGFPAANSTLAGCPPIVTVTGSTGAGRTGPAN